MRRTTILVADDEPYLTYMVASRLREHGADVVVAADGEEALRLAQQHVPDLVVTDFQMPYLDGMALARRLLEIPATSQIPVVLVTARGHRLPHGDLSATNIRQILAKPFSTKELVAVVGDLCKLDERTTAKAKAA